MDSNRGGNRGGGQQHRGGGQRRQQHRDGGGGGRRGTPRAGEERPKRDAILDLAKYRDEEIRVKFQGGRQGMIMHVYQLTK